MRNEIGNFRATTQTPFLSLWIIESNPDRPCLQRSNTWYRQKCFPPPHITDIGRPWIQRKDFERWRMRNADWLLSSGVDRIKGRRVATSLTVRLCHHFDCERDRNWIVYSTKLLYLLQQLHSNVFSSANDIIDVW